MDAAPKVPPKVPPKPKITLQMPPPQSPNVFYGGQRPPSTAGTNSMHNMAGYPPNFGNFNNMQPMTPAAANNQYYNPFMNMYQSKASDFMFKQFEGFKDFTMNTAKSGLSVGEKSAFWMYNKVSKWSKKWFTHIFLFVVIMAYTAAGAAIFVAVEGVNEKITSKDIKLRELELVEELRVMTKNPALTEDPEMWSGEALKRLEGYKRQVTEWVKQGSTDKGKKVWSFWNAMFYCGTIYTTIGYGHIAPSTTTGRAITIVYAIIGIPLFLILLADFGKLFTRCIKFLWAFVRRLYYTGSCKKVRRTVQVQEVMKGLNMVYTAATFRRPSQYQMDEEVGPPLDPNLPQLPPKPNANLLSVPSKDSNKQDQNEELAPEEQEITTPAPSVFEIDDEFNLPISVAIICWIIYIFMGASIYVVWEEWSFFESFYFVFISMSTIGFGDFVPNHPIYMMGSIVYLVFGMALTSMCINVVQVKLSDSFRHASAKIGATIGLRVSDEDGSLAPITPPPVEIPPIHGLTKAETPVEV